jgi:hypothetical protein
MRTIIFARYLQRTVMPKGKNSAAKKSPKAAPKEKTKKIEAAPAAEEHDEEEAETEGFSPKEKVVAIDVEEREDVITPVDKMIADPLLEAESVSVDGHDNDDLGLDEEEIDPFGDKWEA